jgi:hypothetical protein
MAGLDEDEGVCGGAGGALLEIRGKVSPLLPPDSPSGVAGGELVDASAEEEVAEVEVLLLVETIAEEIDDVEIVILVDTGAEDAIAAAAVLLVE